jgi:glycosyltransferase involved in cell wall biosynthesis
VNKDEVAIILPALNEIGSVESVVNGFLAESVRVVLVDNGSTDGTAAAAARTRAEVVSEEKRGYGNACLAGLSYLNSRPPKIVAFADCDGTLDPHELHTLIDPIETGEADLVLGMRTQVEKGALPLHQRFGNALTSTLFRLLYGLRIGDIPPYRACSWSFIARLDLSEPTYGFPIETVAISARKGGRIKEVGVTYRRRLEGRSKVTGSFQSSLSAGWAMISLVVALRFRRMHM